MPSITSAAIARGVEAGKKLLLKFPLPRRSRGPGSLISHGADRPLRVTIVTNVPAPYRLPVYELLDDKSRVDLHVIYSATQEPNREWVLPRSTTSTTVLAARVLTWRGRYIHFASGLVRALAATKPEVVITTGFNQPQLAAFAWCLWHGVPHVAQTDGTIRSESGLSILHQVVRRIVADRTRAFVAASEEGVALQQTWGAERKPVFLSPLAVDNDRFLAARKPSREYDLLFSGRLTPVKNPGFALEVAAEASRLLGRQTSLAIIGNGPLAEQLSARAEELAEFITVEFAGFQQQVALPRWYADARILLLPSIWDPWAIVANEAAASGTPVISAPQVGAAGQLIRDGEGGYVLPLDVPTWASAAARLLSNPGEWEARSRGAVDAVRPFTHRAAADGLRAAALAAAAAAAAAR